MWQRKSSSSHEGAAISMARMRPHSYTYDCVQRPRNAHRNLRNEHNKVKAILIDWACNWVRGPKHVVDLACGKGGDINKWANTASSYVGVDKSQPALHEARRRAQERQSTQGYTFVHADAANFVLPPCNIVSMQFALHYMCSSKNQLQTLMQNIGKALQPNGVFILSTVDERAVPGPNNFGVQYMFCLPPCIDETPEYKVPIDMVRSIASQNSLELCFVRNFDRFLQGAGFVSNVHASKYYIVMAFVKS